MTYSGILLAESLKPDAVLDDIRLTVSKIHRAVAGDVEAGQPRLWTFIEFKVPSEDVERLAQRLSDVLNPDGGWYCDFRSDDETFVIFAGWVFRYATSNRAERGQVEEYGRSVGVPEAQLDWPE